ncbi:three-Cys-motif partner protein TcmP [Pseudomonas aeruginosa]|uniref:three-Cys-motif partner protein TcmP n=1 Tax=Pseudomonas aeruginosa TaxID=287 RepID=UPI00093EC4E9|nr:three-Cys-motif partner protein TcmP [Pseudomonas aeruginosa]
MVRKKFDWENGAKLEDHSRRKHKILREYFYQYIITRCQLPKQERFRLAIIDGFSGAGRYICGTAGSPIIFMEELNKATKYINIQRAEQGLPLIEIECFLILNDSEPIAVELLKENIYPLHAEIRDTNRQLHIKTHYMSNFFEQAYSEIKSLLRAGRYKSTIFNLDQCGHSQVRNETLADIIRSNNSAEIFYTFAIETLLAFLQKTNPKQLATQLSHLSINEYDIAQLDTIMDKKSWLGTAERIVYSTFKKCAQFVSPFSINNPNGWRYWLIHLASFYRARQVYNNILHINSGSQAHYGRSGLNMLAHDPSEEGKLYLFDSSARDDAKIQLLEDIPKLISSSGDAVRIEDFYSGIYNSTPAHSDDIKIALIENPDIEIITESGGTRRKASQIKIDDTVRLKNQRSFFPIFLNNTNKKD